MNTNEDLDPVFSSDRNTGSTAPEAGERGNNVVGRPVDSADHSVGFHENAENASKDRESFSDEEAVHEGGSFDGLGLPVAIDTEH